MDKKQKRQLTKIFLTAAIFLTAFLLPEESTLSIAFFLAAYALIGYSTLFSALRNILRGQVFDENFLMAIASLGAIVLGEYPEAVAVMMFYQVGEWFESVAVGKSRKSISALMDIRPDYANLLRDGKEQRVDPEEVRPGDLILVKPGEKVPLDGVVKEGASALDTSALTGESVPRDVSPGEEVVSGSINISGLLTVKVSKEFGESTVSKILELVEHAGSRKANIETFITKFARYYTPAVVIVAVLLALIPPLIVPGAAFSDWVYRALVFLVVSCPCALVISIPLSFFGGVGGASKRGILVKGSNFLEAVSRAETVVFDKTGTLTKGIFEVSGIVRTKSAPQEIDEARLLELAAYAEYHSSHPISLSIRKAYGKAPEPSRISGVQEIAGHGTCAKVSGILIHAGNLKLMRQALTSGEELVMAEEADGDVVGTVVHLAVNNQYAGYIAISDTLKPDAAAAISALKSMGIRKSVMLTGDKDAIGQKIAAELSLDAAYTELLPQDKVEKIEMLLAEKSPKGTLIFVGDGINDAPVLARADVGVAMGALGSDAAIEAADIVIMTDEPSKLATVIKISKKTLTIAKQNIVFALSIKAIVLLLGALGIASMWAAVFADVGVAFLAILNAMRALRSDRL